MINILVILLNIFISADFVPEWGTLVGVWGTIDTVLPPRGSIRVWVKIINSESMESTVISNDSLIPRWSLISDRDTFILSSSGYLGTFDKYLTFRPNNGIFFYDLIELFPISGKFSDTTTNASLCLRETNSVHYLNACITFPIGKIDNPFVENFMSRWDSIRYKAITKTGFCGAYARNQYNAQKQCELMKQSWDQLSRNNQLTGNLVGAAYKIRLSACNEGPKPIPYQITPTWKEFESAKSCIDGFMLRGDDNKMANQKCKSKILDLHTFTEKLAGAKTVIPLDNGVKFVSNLDTLQVYPIDYWPIRK